MPNICTFSVSSVFTLYDYDIKSYDIDSNIENKLDGDLKHGSKQIAVILQLCKEKREANPRQATSFFLQQNEYLWLVFQVIIVHPSCDVFNS